ncbi:CCN family member 3-like [Scyliorhinus canicula]|uniref:CCN family member 3-like n=1 Tax=Scyliorhinus canicula TaxID=7830 RepID=UPI0018F3493D|nr:CCN family member 3-like [Scyliorhinus canicula]
MQHLTLTLLPLLLLLLTTERVSAQQCPSLCKCPKDPPRCTTGIRLVLDGCGCCRVCAKQAGEVCTESDTCDSQQGLECDRSADSRQGLGVCIAHEGNICMYDGVVYRNGETFQPSCKYQCSCKDGLIGCVPRCNLDVLLPGPDCPFPKQVQMPGECCEQWVCHHKQEAPVGGLAMAAYRQEATYELDSLNPSLNCIQQTTQWSACSKTCGMGISTRVTNKNPRCDMVKQTRICEVRPCGNYKVTVKKGKKCARTPKATKPTRFEHNECISVQSYKPKYCGVCNDGRCCTPHSTKTAQLDFKCPGGIIIKKQMMIITTCACHYNCPEDNTVLQTDQTSGP